MREGKLMLFAGSSNPELTQAVASSLKTNLCNVALGRFADGEIAAQINESVRGQDVFV